MKIMQLSLILLAATAAGSCATDFPQVDANLGKSEAQMVSSQTLDPQAAAHPAALAPAIADGQRMQNVLDAHRKDVPQASKQVSQQQQFDAGSNSGG